MSYRVICAVGDSITDGFWDEEGLGWFGRLGIKLAKTYPHQFNCRNLAISGDRSVDTLNRMRSELPSRDPDILLIATGLNDLLRWGGPEAATNLSEGLQAEMWRKILRIAKTVSHAAVLGIPPVDESRNPSVGSGGLHYWNMNSDIDAYNQRIKSWCGKEGILFIDLASQWKSLSANEYLYDATHPNAKGHQLICDQVFDELLKLGIISEH